MKRSEKFKKFNISKKLGIATAIIVAIILMAFITYIFMMKNKVEQWNNKMYPGVVINDIDLSGKTKEEATELLNANFSNTVVDKKLIVKSNGEEVSINYHDLNPHYNIDEIVNEAFNYGKSGNLFEKYEFIKDGSVKRYNLEFAYNEDKIKEYENQLASKVDKAPKNATVSINNGSISITNDVIGTKINKDEMTKLIKENINGNLEQSDKIIDVPTDEVQPKITRSMLSKIDGIISSFTSSFAHNSQPGRDKNLFAATKYVNGTLILPGETFSYNETVGERTKARGFDYGGIMIGDRIEDGLGGGICQVSTALYRAVMRAGIKSVERHNHSMQTSYSPLGLDATVAWGSLDYKFKNTYDFPIYIEGYIAPDKTIVFNLYGNKESMNGKTYELYAEANPNNSKQVRSYLVTYQNGAEIKRENIATDVYK